MAEILKGKPVADAMNEELAPRIEACKAAGVTPTLAIVRVGERADALSMRFRATRRRAKRLRSDAILHGLRRRPWSNRRSKALHFHAAARERLHDSSL